MSEIFYGVELEFTRPNARTSNASAEINAEFQQSVEKLNKEVNATGRDGGGVEVNNPPKPFEFYKTSNESFQKFFEYVSSCTKKHDFNGDSDQAGMHIHVDRNVMKYESFSKMIKLLGDAQFKSFLKVFTRRKTRTSFWDVTSPSGKTGLSSVNLTKAHYEDKNNLRGSNCITLNTHGKYGTIEFRFFNGTNVPAQIAEAVQFIRALIFYSKSTKRMDKSFDGFLTYVNDYSLKYPDFKAYLVANKYLSPTVVKKKRAARKVPA